MRHLRKELIRQGGAAIVEFAILLPLLVLLAVGIMEYGRAMYQYDTLTKSARSAARFLSQYAAGNTAAIDLARNLAVCGQRDCQGIAPLLPGLNAGHVSICDASSCTGTHASQASGAGVLNLVSVRISGYPFSPVVPLMVPAITFGPIEATFRQAS